MSDLPSTLKYDSFKTSQSELRVLSFDFIISVFLQNVYFFLSGVNFDAKLESVTLRTTSSRRSHVLALDLDAQCSCRGNGRVLS